MILSYEQIGELYFYICVDHNKNIDQYAVQISDTVMYLLDSEDDDNLITYEGHHHILWAITEILAEIYRNKDVSGYQKLLQLIPESLYKKLDTLNNEKNGHFIRRGVRVRDLFSRASKRSVDYFE